MNAQPAAAPSTRRAVESKHVVSDVDLRGLRVRGVALELVLLARHEAFRQGTLQPALSNVRAARELGVTVRTVQRAKRSLERAGVVMIERRSRHVGERGSEHLAHRFQLDRRALTVLHVQRPALQLVRSDGHGGVTAATPPIGSSKPLEEESPSGSPPPPEGRSALPARDGPPDPRSLAEVQSVTKAVGSALPAVAPLGEPATGPAGTASSTGKGAWLNVLPVHVAAWMCNVGPHLAEVKRDFHAEVRGLGRHELNGRDVERCRQHLLREAADRQLELGSGPAP